MKNKMIPNKKSMLSMMVSIIVGLGASGVSYAGLKATSDDKGGSFKYVVPTGGTNSDQCPGPYESVALTFVNNTTDVTSGHGLALAYNIFYVVDDERTYTGNYAYPENDQNVFPSENSSIKDAEYATGNSNWTYYGPIEGTFINSGNTSQIPVRADVSKNDNPLRTSSIYGDLAKEYGADKVKVMTVYAKSGNFMDWTSSGKNTVSIRLPVRSYKRLLIETSATDVPSAKAAATSAWNDPKNLTSAGTTISVVFDAVAMSSTNGTLVDVLAYRPISNGIVTHTTSSAVTQNKEQSPQVGSFPFQSSINLRQVDQILITNKGNYPVSTTSGIVWSGDTFFSGSTISVKYLTDKTTGQKVTCE